VLIIETKQKMNYYQLPIILFKHTTTNTNYNKFLSTIHNKQRPDQRVAKELIQHPEINSNNTTTVVVGTPYEQNIRNRTSVESLLSVDKLEDELRQEIAAVLGRVDRKLQSELDILKTMAQKIDQLQQQQQNIPSTTIHDHIREYNKHITICEESRWKLIIQRQAAGFVSGNYELICRLYPIPKRKRIE
jgi:hypothetical protein